MHKSAKNAERLRRQNLASLEQEISRLESELV